jgi:hypothetical protein
VRLLIRHGPSAFPYTFTTSLASCAGPNVICRTSSGETQRRRNLLPDKIEFLKLASVGSVSMEQELGSGATKGSVAGTGGSSKGWGGSSCEGLIKTLSTWHNIGCCRTTLGG